MSHLKKEYTYAESGVDRKLREKSKGYLRILKTTYKLSKYGDLLHLPYSKILPVRDGYLDLVIEGVGTKVLVAQVADKFDTIGIDGVAMAVNDVIRSGATPIVLVDNIHAQNSDPNLVKELLKGVSKGAYYSGCPVLGGEIGDVDEIIQGVREKRGFDMVVACLGEVKEAKIIIGDNIQSGDVIIGLRSSGIHSNGVTLARKVLLKEWGGVFDLYDIPKGFEKPIVYEILEPTRIYVKPFLGMAKEVEVKAAVHITGDAYLKFEKLMLHNHEIGFEFSNFKPHPIFSLIQESAEKRRGVISDLEMLTTFNMGWGFACIVDSKDVEMSLDILESEGEKAEVIGHVNKSGKISAIYKGEHLIIR